MKLLFFTFGVLLLAACGSGEPSAEHKAEQVNATTTTDAVDTLPPGFTDTPPPGPTSDTTILSGGTFLLTESIDDSVVVITNNSLLAWGPRGGIDLPNDSIGMDMRGRWIIPGVAADVATGNLNTTASISSGDPAELLIFSSDPTDTEDLAGSLYAIVSAEGIEIFAAESD